MMADVAGFTALTERYTNTGKGGTYRLTVTLNTYIGALVDIIYNHGGDVIKFAGDAFLALWKTDKKTFLSHTIHSVITCALVIQHSYAKYETDVKVNLRVKLAISAGNLLFSVIGSGIDMNYVIFGLPVIEAKLAESVCSSGEVKLTPSAWAHCYSRNYDHVVDDDGHVTIKTILYDPNDKEVNKPYLGFATLIRNIRRPYTTIESLPNNLMDSPKNLSPSDIAKKAEALYLRKSVLVAEERNIGSDIRKFMIQPVLTQIDAHQPLEYLTEMRQVSVLFITLKPRQCAPLQLITIVNNAYQITCEIVYKSMGCVNKIILFDKDVMILVIFGLRGFKHESEAQAALKCGYSIRKSLAALDGVLNVSLGVTTGQVYCGVVGHPLRREFTVIGAIVNKAARLMCTFHNKITCDETTFMKSKMSSNSFTLQPKTELKGIQNSGKIYEYSEEIRLKELGTITTIPPLLDREEELQFFDSWMKQSGSVHRDFDALLLVGESRIGKSRMLEWMSRKAHHKKFNISSINLTSIHSATSYLALSQIIEQILDIPEPSATGFIKEQKICDVLKTYDEDLCYLNNILKVRFAYHEGIFTQDEEKRNEKAKIMFRKLIKAIRQPHMIFLDDLHNLDAASWEYISIIFESMKIFTVLSVTRGKFSSVHTWLYSVFINENVRKMVLGPLASVWIPPLACQILDVDAVPRDLCNALVVKCNGMPGLVESFIVHLFSTGAIDLKKIPQYELEEYNDEALRFPDSNLLRPVAVNINQQEELDVMLQENEADEVSICVVTEKEELDVNINVQNVDALIMIQIDSLTPYQQLLLKIASVIGNVFSRDLLESIMYENQPLTTAKAIKRLFAMRILGCANAKVKVKKFSSMSSTHTQTSRLNSNNTNLVCECPTEYDPDHEEDLPKYAYCQVIKFKNKNSQLTCYELLPMNQKKEFHARVVNYLECNNQKCPECGGTLIVLESYMNFFPCEEDALPSVIPVTREDSYGSSSYSETEYSDPDDRKTSDVLNSASEMLRRETNFLLPLHNYTQSHSILKNSGEGPVNWNRASNKRVTVSSFIFRSLSQIDVAEPLSQIMLRPLLEARDLSEWHELGVIDSTDHLGTYFHDQNVSIPIQKGVSSIDFKKCTCSDLNILLHEQLLTHALFAEMKEKIIEFSVQLSYLNLMAHNIESALEAIAKAEEILTKQSKDLNLSSIEKKIYLGRVYSLRAACEFIKGNLFVSKMHIERACRIYGLKINQVTSDLVRFKALFKHIKIRKRKYKEHEEIITADSVFCLNIATSVYFAMADDKTAKLTSTWALERIQQVDCRLEDICDALSIGTQLELDRGFIEGTIEIERIFKRVITKMKEPIQADKLYSIGKVLMATFRARMARAELPAAIRVGFRAMIVSKFLHAYNISIDIIPDLFYILLARKRFEEAVDVVQLAIVISRNKESQAYETWYYALSMDLILDAGFQLASPISIYKYSYSLLMESNNGGAARRRLFVNLWTYWLRMDNERRAKKFEEEALSWSTKSDLDDGSLTTLVSSLRLAEGMLESLARKMDDLRKVQR